MQDAQETPTTTATLPPSVYLFLYTEYDSLAEHSRVFPTYELAERYEHAFLIDDLNLEPDTSLEDARKAYLFELDDLGWNYQVAHMPIGEWVYKPVGEEGWGIGGPLSVTGAE